MNSLLPTVTAVTVAGAIASNTYNGDGHVTGSGTGTSSYTLAQLDPANNGMSYQGRQAVTIPVTPIPRPVGNPATSWRRNF
jgi:hypothetical protein